jgi:hypothetical protein
MAKCPVCASEVKTPFLLNADAWRWLKCAHCGTRLERKNPRFLLPLIALYLCLLALGQLGPRWSIVEEVGMAVIAVLMVVQFLRPELQTRKAPPEPEITLKIDGETKNKCFDVQNKR